MKNELSTLIKVSLLSESKELTVSDDFERRVMIEVARRAIERSRRRARFGLAASLSGLAMLLAACITGVVVWFPVNVVLSVDLDAAIGQLLTTIRLLF